MNININDIYFSEIDINKILLKNDNKIKLNEDKSNTFVSVNFFNDNPVIKIDNFCQTDSIQLIFNNTNHISIIKSNNIIDTQSDNIKEIQTDNIKEIQTDNIKEIQTDNKEIQIDNKEIQTEFNKKKIDFESQTELTLINSIFQSTNFFPTLYLPTPGIIVEDPIIFYRKENLKLKQQINNLTTNFNELLQLVSNLIKIDSSNSEIETIKRNLTIIVNRELRMKYAFPFINIK